MKAYLLLFFLLAILIFGCLDTTQKNDMNTSKKSTDSYHTNQTTNISVLNQKNETEKEKERLMSSPRELSFFYILGGQNRTINYTVYYGVYSYIHSLPRDYYCTVWADECRSVFLATRYIDEPVQREYMLPLVEAIRNQTNNTDDQARIAISLVQNIPYDSEGVRTGKLGDSYPYEVLYENIGACEEKSRLLVFLLRELGYGSALFTFTEERHMAVGIKCTRGQYRGEYCFVETTMPTIITDSWGDYQYIGQLTSTPLFTRFNDDGRVFDSSEEDNDTRSWRLLQPTEYFPMYIGSDKYYEWYALRDKYGLNATIIEDNSTG